MTSKSDRDRFINDKRRLIKRLLEYDGPSMTKEELAKEMARALEDGR